VLTGPVGAVVPVDAVAASGDCTADGCAVPICGDVKAAIEMAFGGTAGFVGETKVSTILLYIAALRVVAAAIPGAVNVGAAPSATTSTVIAA
jgi:hypothetical protein